MSAPIQARDFGSSGSKPVRLKEKTTCTACFDAQAVFCRRRNQTSRPPLAKIRPGRPAPTMGAGTCNWYRASSGGENIMHRRF